MTVTGYQQWMAREEIVRAVFELAGARQHSDIHPEDPHSIDNVDLHVSMLDDALANYVTVVSTQAVSLPAAPLDEYRAMRKITSDD